MAYTEPIYDEKINPLMKQVIAICKEHQIPFVASFELTFDKEQHDSEEPLFCTSAILPPSANERLQTAANVLQFGVLASWLHDMKKAGLVPVPTTY